VPPVPSPLALAGGVIEQDLLRCMSPSRRIDGARLFSQPERKAHVLHQKVTGTFPTAEAQAISVAIFPITTTKGMA
jgi:hypothetical protein